MPTFELYRELMALYGPRGWWPVSSCRSTEGGYHPGEYDWPRSDADRYEIAFGAVLTQSTAWSNVRLALKNLAARSWLDPAALLEAPAGELAEEIKPSLYYNQKLKKLRFLAEYLIGLGGRSPTREDLLSLWGIGPETADSILLYGWNVPEFVVDAYTRRFAEHLGLIGTEAGYEELKALFTENLPVDVVVYQEYHALLVEHGKRHYSRRPYGAGDPVARKIISIK
jgi:endonuclease-3 related protein